MLKLFEDKEGVIAAISEKKDGSMRIYIDGRNDKNRQSFLEKCGIKKEKVFSAGIVHGACVKTVDKYAPLIIDGADALVTKDKVALSVTVADCIPVYFYVKNSKIIALAHAGWRGILGGIIENTLSEISRLGGRGNDIEVVLGPGLRACHFEIKRDILGQFKKYSRHIINRDDKIFVDLFGIIREKLTSEGVLRSNIFESGECTFCDKNKFYSFRRDKPKETEAMMAIIGLSNDIFI